MKKPWPPGVRGIAKGFCPAINGSVALTFPFSRGSRRAARQAFVAAMHETGCPDTWRTLYRHGYRIVPVKILVDDAG